MKKTQLQQSDLITRYFSLWHLALWALCISVVSYVIFAQTGLTLAYGDAMSHLNLSRFVIDNQEPGLSQIGGVWLPLTHILPLLLIWNDWAWQTGFAGSLFSMLAYVGTAIAVYLTVYMLSRKVLAAIVGAFVFLLNINMLYLQATALTEPLYLVFFSFSVYFFIKWIVEKKDVSLILLGLMGFFQVLTRYDGWFVVILEGLLLVYLSIVLHKQTIVASLGRLVLFSFPVAFGIFLWLLWGLLIFNDPFFFAFGEYSARSQQDTIETTSGLITKGSFYYSLKAYWHTMLHNVGELPFAISLFGVGLFLLFRSKMLASHGKYAIIIFLAGPIIFNVLALYLGFSIVNIPELGWNPSGEEGGQWFNVRYGILALPFVAVFAGIFASWKKLAIILVLELVLLQHVFFAGESIAVIDGTKGSSSYRYEDVSTALSQNVEEDEMVLLSTSFFNPVAFKSDIYLRQVIHEGASKTWEKALLEPENYAEWIVAAKGSIGEPVYTALVEKQSGRFLTHYDLFYRGLHADVYKRKTVSVALQE